METSTAKRAWKLRDVAVDSNELMHKCCGIRDVFEHTAKVLDTRFAEVTRAIDELTATLADAGGAVQTVYGPLLTYAQMTRDLLVKQRNDLRNAASQMSVPPGENGDEIPW